MAICSFPKTSSLIGKASTSCLRRFTIHFRRPDTLKQKQNAPYKGEYGFDWLRDEYIYPIEKIKYDNHLTNARKKIKNKILPLCLKPKKLKEEYKKDVENPIKPYEQDYYPAWLSIFACDVQGNNADAGSELHKDGVYLDLQLDEIDEIINDGTEIFFKTSDPCLKITPNKIAISEFLNTSKEKRKLNEKIGKPEIHFYKLENAVKIICQGDTLKEHGQIKVFAKLGSTEIEVGQLMVYQNDIIGKANIFVVNVITKYDNNNNKIIPQSHPSLDNLFNSQSFNQAMIKVEIKAIEDFDLFALKEKEEDVKKFLDDINNSIFVDENSRTQPSVVRNNLCDLYNHYGKHKPKDNISINDEGHYNTYLLFTNKIIEWKNQNTVKGIAYYSGTPKRDFEWGNMFVIFGNALTEDHTIVHEAGHSFSLPHSFEWSLSPHIFYHGYTENYMDYSQHQYLDSKRKPRLERNKYSGNMYSFFKWQWDLMRKDKSIEILQKE